MALGDDTIIFRAKTLAQAHPLSAAASAIIDRVVRRQVDALPMPEMGRWAATAMLTGYCVRVVEEEAAGLGDPPATEDLDALDEASDTLLVDVRTDEADRVILGAPEEIIGALDAVVEGEVAKRADPWRTQVGADAWASFEEFIAHHVVKGYALRAAETASSRPRSAT